MNNLQIYQVATGKASNILTKMCSILTVQMIVPNPYLAI